ncbi:hypothetical protein [Megasphaera sp.]|uniref:hypothetical protein n=1 Tax=Megasphaera TaxID=906 RepID=UPI001E0F6580|nr:hypothetical protein [Megasphaera sp.]MBS6790903.1 hypothetical protein [Megasphaera sp.]
MKITAGIFGLMPEGYREREIIIKIKIMTVDAGPMAGLSHDGSLWFQLAIPLSEIRKTIDK